MRKSFRLSLLAAAMAAVYSPGASALDGAWRGDLAFGGTKIPLVFNFSENEEGKTSCTLDSPSQGAKGIPATVLLCTADSVSLECTAIGAKFNGKISDDIINGNFSQRGFAFPLELKQDAPIGERRPQTPKPPYPYTVIDTVFTAPDGIVLAGTITMPVTDKKKKVPAVVMITGSGAQNRDEEIFDHKPFAVIADYLARNGVASLRYDDRGTGKSQGDFRSGTTCTFEGDARNAVKFMRSISGIGKTGVLGHSEGGTIAFMLGADKVPDFIISLAGMAVTGKETLMEQNERALAKAGVAGSDKDNCLKVISSLFDEIAKQGNSGISTTINVDSLAMAAGVSVPPMLLASIKSTQKVRTPWFDKFVGLDPGEYIKKIKCPVLAINGEKDTQVKALTNLAVIRKFCPKAEVKAMPDLNHLMQHAQTGDMAEYDEIRETISPEVLEIILNFVRN